MSKPTTQELQQWLDDGGCEATDGCWVEPDGHCEHGHQPPRLPRRRNP